MLKEKQLKVKKKRIVQARSNFTDMSFIDEPLEWLKLSPCQRLKETTKLWQLYLTLGGSLDPEPDPQSPFYFQEMQG